MQLTNSQKGILKILLLLFMFDIVVTTYGYFHGNFNELNPIYQKLMFDPYIFIGSLILLHTSGFYAISKIVDFLNAVESEKYATRACMFGTFVMFMAMLVLSVNSLWLCFA